MMSNKEKFRIGFWKWNWAAWVSTLSNYVMFGFVAFIVALLVLDRFEITILGINDPWSFLSKAVPYIFVLFVTRVYSKDIQLMEMASAALEQKHGVIDVIDDPAPQISKLLAESKNICVLTLSGSSIHSNDEHDFLDLINTKRIRSLSIAIADPFSPAIVERYAKDEPNSAKSGPEIIKETLIEMHRILQNAPATLKAKVEIRVYQSYPTQSVFTADGEVLVSAYGYKLRKADTPTTYTRSNTRLGLGAQKHFDEVFASAIPLSLWICNNFGQLNEIVPVDIYDHYSGVFIGLKNSDEYLFQRRGKSKGIENPGLLSVFGGRRELSDRDEPILTAIRELNEETNIRVGTDQINLICELPYVPNESNSDVILASYYIIENIDESSVEIREGKCEIMNLARAAAHPDMTPLPREVMRRFRDIVPAQSD